jgi:hypothetical protein
VHCDEAEVYTEGQRSKNGATAPTSPAPERVASPAKAPPPETRPAPEASDGLLIRLSDSENAEEDTHVLREVMRTLLEYSGTARVRLEISTGGRRVLMDLPMITTLYCPELHERLEELLGPGSVRVEGRA